MRAAAPANGRMKMQRTPVVRCAIYTRKSTTDGLEQDFNSLDNQRERSEDYIRSQQEMGWIVLPTRYDDGGVSGALADRPALNRLLADIEAGQIDRVIVYKTDRLYRSVFHLGELLHRMDARGVSLVSVTEPFDTSTPAGRFMLHILASSAQMERELVAERTRDKIHAARKRGKWTGGPPPLGYDVHPDGGKILVNKEEADQVLAIFDLYLEVGTITGTVRALNARGWTTKTWTTKSGRERKGTRFTKASLRGLLSNPIYTGKTRLNGEVFDGEHDGIVAQATFDRAQAQLDRNGAPAVGVPRGRPGCALLAGLLRCGPCDAAMTPTHTTRRGRRYPYYVCRTTKTDGWSACPSKSIPAHEIERLVVGQIRGIGRDPALQARVLEAVREQGGEADEADLRRALALFDPVWDALHTRERARILALLIERVAYDGEAGTVEITFRPSGIEALAQEVAP